MKIRRRWLTGSWILTALLLLSALAWSADSPQWGEFHSRNMISKETGLPVQFDPKTGAGIKWTADLGDSAYGSPVIASGKVLIGANNANPRDPERTGDRAVLLCLNEADGALLWQLAVPRIGGDKYLDWPGIAMCSPPSVEGDRVHMVTNRDEVMCLDLDGMADSNDGPYQDEGTLLADPEKPAKTGPLDADIIWRFDMPSQAGTYPHDAAHVSIAIDGPLLYLNSCNGVDNTHAVVRKPEAPGLLVIEKATGRMVARDQEGMGKRVFHSIWSSPAMGIVNGKPLVFFGGPSAEVYGFAALSGVTPDPVRSLERVWLYECDATAPRTDLAKYLKNNEEGPSSISAMPVFYRNRIYVTYGGDIWWGKRQAWLKCIDATKTGDITETGTLWVYPLEKHACSTPAIVNGLVFVTDCGGLVHCVDAETGTAYWTHPVGNEIWGSTLAADGKIYVGSRSGDFAIFKADKEKQVLSEIPFGTEIASTPAAANGTLYVSTLQRLYAIGSAR